MKKVIILLTSLTMTSTHLVADTIGVRTHAPLSPKNIIIDTGKIDNIEIYNADVMQCQALAEQAEVTGGDQEKVSRKALRGAAVTAGAIAIAGGGSKATKGAARVGAAAGMAVGVAQKQQNKKEEARAHAEQQHLVNVNCLTNRGYIVLNS